jgi:RNA polymerase sigma factor (sigma-70 family)
MAALAPVEWRSVSSSEKRELREASRGNAEASEALVRRYWPIAYRTAYLIVQNSAQAEDVAQEAMLASIQSIGRFDRRRRFAPWLHRIVVNRALDSLRSERRRRQEIEYVPENVPTVDPSQPQTDGRHSRRTDRRHDAAPDAGFAADVTRSRVIRPLRGNFAPCRSR